MGGSMALFNKYDYLFLRFIITDPISPVAPRLIKQIANSRHTLGKSEVREDETVAVGIDISGSSQVGCSKVTSIRMPPVSTPATKTSIIMRR